MRYRGAGGGGRGGVPGQNVFDHFALLNAVLVSKTNVLQHIPVNKTSKHSHMRYTFRGDNVKKSFVPHKAGLLYKREESLCLLG